MEMQEKTRDTYFDNLKTMLIFSVVLGHFVNLNASIPLLGAVSNVIYAFHMPLFIFISGYFSKSITTQRSSEIENVLYPFVVFQLLNFVFTKSTGLGFGSANIFIPTYQNWYLLGLFIWRALIPYYNLFNQKFSLLLTIALSFTIGFFAEFNSFLGLYRILYFFPAFILGYYCSDLQAFLQKRSRFKYLFICISSLGLLSIFGASLYSSNLNGMISVAFTPFLGYNDSMNIFYLRLIGFASSFILSIGLLYLVPKGKYKLTYLGENTLNIFLLHTFIVFPINKYLAGHSPYLILLISVVASLLICLLLSNQLLHKLMAPLTKLKQLRLLFKKDR